MIDSNSKIEAKRIDAYTYQMVLGDTLVGFATRMADGSWRAKTLEDKIFGNQFATAKAVARDFYKTARMYARSVAYRIDDLLGIAA